jgi:hypothetical protein
MKLKGNYPGGRQRGHTEGRMWKEIELEGFWKSDKWQGLVSRQPT